MNAAARAALALVGVTARYGSRVALDDVSLEVLPGTITAVLGPNGAGKSTLVGLAAGLRAPDAGTVQVVGGDPRSRAGRRGRRVGLAPQDLGLYPGLTVAQNLAGFGEAAGLSAHDARRRAAEVAEPFVLAHLLDRPAGQLSGGEQRRLHAAVAVVHRPALVLLDEPTAGADVQTRDALLAVVRDLTADGTAVLYTTHYLPEVERLDAAVVVLEQGRVVAQGSLATLVGAHALGALVLRFDGAVPLGALPADVEVVVDGASVRLVCAQPELRLAGVLAALGDDVARLQAVELVPPSLEAVYLALTGRRHAVGAA